MRDRQAGTGGLGGLVLAVVLGGCGDDGSSGSAGAVGSSGAGDATGQPADSTGTSADESTGAAVVVSGDAFAFTLPGEDYGRIDGATISVLEQPSVSVTTDAEGHFELPELPPGSEATFVLQREGFPVAHTKTFTLPEAGPLGQVTFQVPDDELFALLAGVLMIEVDPGVLGRTGALAVGGKQRVLERVHQGVGGDSLFLFEDSYCVDDLLGHFAAPCGISGARCERSMLA